MIPTALFKDYRKFFKPAHLKGPDQRRYNTDLLAQMVGEAFLFSLDPANGIEVPAYGFALSTWKMTAMGLEPVSQHKLKRHYVREAMEACGLPGDPQLVDCGLDFNFRFASWGLQRASFWRGRSGVTQVLRQEDLEGMVKLGERFERYERRIKKRENIK